MCIFFSSFRLVAAVNHHLGVAVRLVRFGSALFELSRRIMGISARLEYVFGFLVRFGRVALGVRLRRVGPRIPILTHGSG